MTNDKSIEAFEAWKSSQKSFDLSRYVNWNYTNHLTCREWEAWQAATKHQNTMIAAAYEKIASWIEKAGWSECAEQVRALTPAYAKAALDEIIQSLANMTALTKLKYGNLEPSVCAEIQKAEAIIERVKK